MSRFVAHLRINPPRARAWGYNRGTRGNVRHTHGKGEVEAIYDRHRYVAIWADHVIAVVEERNTKVTCIEAGVTPDGISE
jgi:hypothetical protein